MWLVHLSINVVSSARAVTSMSWTRLWKACWYSQHGLGLLCTLAKSKVCSVPTWFRGTQLVLNSPALGAEQLILSEMVQLAFQEGVMMDTLHVKYTAIETSRIITIFIVFFDLFSASTWVCYFCKRLIYFLSDLLRTKQEPPMVIECLFVQLITVITIKWAQSWGGKVDNIKHKKRNKSK